MTESEAIERAVEVAEGEEGYYEKASNAELDDKTANRGNRNYTKYGRDLDAISDYYNGRKNGFEWCDQYIDWVFVKAFGYPIGRVMLCQPERSLGAGTGHSARYFQSAGRFYAYPHKGDQIFFRTNKGEICHTGLVVGVADGKVYTIEGNTQNMVARRTYSMNDWSIAGYGRPRWSLVADVPVQEPATKPSTKPTTKPKTGVVNVETKELSKGSKGQAVKSMQLLLIGNGYSCGDAGADGDFGDATKGAVMAFQKKKRLTQDGICGTKTWTKLING